LGGEGGKRINQCSQTAKKAKNRGDSMEERGMEVEGARTPRIGLEFRENGVKPITEKRKKC